jgi:hypothetical protein
MGPPGLERKLRIRALRSSWIKDAIQALAFTRPTHDPEAAPRSAQGCRSVSSLLYQARRWSSASRSTGSVFVRRAEYSILNVELQLA